ncbi:hypothetical protein D3C72_2115930 [compost metagenome]
MLAHARQYLRRRRQGRVADLGPLQFKGFAVLVAVLAAVKQCGQRRNTLEQLIGPFLELHRLAMALQHQAWATTLLDHIEEVVRAVAALQGAQQWTAIQGAEQQEGIEEA